MKLEDKHYVLLMEVFTVTSWRNGCVHAVESEGLRFITGHALRSNDIASSNIVYVPVSIPGWM